MHIVYCVPFIYMFIWQSANVTNGKYYCNMGQRSTKEVNETEQLKNTSLQNYLVLESSEYKSLVNQ